MEHDDLPYLWFNIPAVHQTTLASAYNLKDFAEKILEDL